MAERGRGAVLLECEKEIEKEIEKDRWIGIFSRQKRRKFRDRAKLQVCFSPLESTAEWTRQANLDQCKKISLLLFLLRIFCFHSKLHPLNNNQQFRTCPYKIHSYQKANGENGSRK